MHLEMHLHEELLSRQRRSQRGSISQGFKCGEFRMRHSIAETAAPESG